MGFLDKLFEATVRATVGTAVSVLDDVTSIGDGRGLKTVENLEKTVENVVESVEDLTDGDIL